MIPRRVRPGFASRGVLITGASSGIGAALARRLGREGARLVLLARREEALARVAEAVRREGGEAFVLPCDLREAKAAHEAGHEAERLLGPGGVEVLVHNAGFGGHRPVEAWPLEDVERMTAVNYVASVALTKALLPSMLARGGGAMVFVASVAGRLPTPREAPYAASKAAMLAFAESLACEVEDRGVHVMTVCPGVIDTPFFSEEERRRMPGVARRGMVPAEGLAEAILRGLARRRREVTHPAAIAVAYPVKALLPGLFRRILKRVTREGRA